MGAYPQTRVFNPSPLFSGPVPIDIHTPSESPYLMFDLSGVSGSILAATLKYSVEMTFISALWSAGHDLTVICPAGWTTPAGPSTNFVLPGSNAGVGAWRVLYDVPKKLITLLSSSGAGVALRGGRIFTLRPGVSIPDAQVYPDWATMFAAVAPLAAAKVEYTVVFDLGGLPFQADAGTYDFGGLCIWAGTRNIGVPEELDVDGTVTTIAGVHDFTDALSVHSIGATAAFHVPAATQQTFIVGISSELTGDAGPLIDCGAGGLVVVGLIEGGTLRNNGSPVIDLNAGGFSGCFVSGLEGAVVGTDVVRTVDQNNFLVSSKSEESASMYNAQPSFAGAYVVGQSNFTSEVDFGGNVAAGLTTYSLPYNGTQPGNVGFTTAVGDTAYTTPLFQPYPRSVNRMLVRIQRAGVGAGTAQVTLRKNGVAIPGLTVNVSFAAAGTYDVTPSSTLVSDLVLQPGDLLDCIVDTSAGAFTAPQAIFVQALCY